MIRLPCGLLVRFLCTTAGAIGARLSPRPLFFAEGETEASLGRFAPREPDACLAMPSAVIARAGGRSSIPETPAMEPKSRGLLDPPPARGMTVTGWGAWRRGNADVYP